ncbi:hypothetical protein LBYZC6_51860 [Lacrimispora brassicae]
MLEFYVYCSMLYTAYRLLRMTLRFSRVIPRIFGRVMNRLML